MLPPRRAHTPAGRLLLVCREARGHSLSLHVSWRDDPRCSSTARRDCLGFGSVGIGFLDRDRPSYALSSPPARRQQSRLVQGQMAWPPQRRLPGASWTIRSVDGSRRSHPAPAKGPDSETVRSCPSSDESSLIRAGNLTEFTISGGTSLRSNPNQVATSWTGIWVPVNAR